MKTIDNKNFKTVNLKPENYKKGKKTFFEFRKLGKVYFVQ